MSPLFNVVLKFLANAIKYKTKEAQHDQMPHYFITFMSHTHSHLATAQKHSLLRILYHWLEHFSLRHMYASSSLFIKLLREFCTDHLILNCKTLHLQHLSPFPRSIFFRKFLTFSHNIFIYCVYLLFLSSIRI